jgi:hypothetical protein
MDICSYRVLLRHFATESGVATSNWILFCQDECTCVVSEIPNGHAANLLASFFEELGIAARPMGLTADRHAVVLGLSAGRSHQP